MTNRHVPLEGNLNLRDLGGYSSARGGEVRSGCVFRSDELHALTDQDVSKLAGLGIRVVFDLRNDVERQSRPSRLWDGVELHERETPSSQTEPGKTIEDDIRSGFEPEDAKVIAVYVDQLTGLAPEFRRVLELAVDAEERPLLFHCVAGKDRTGLAAALLLGLLGVDEETILDDYELTTTLATEMRFARVAHLVDEHGRDAQKVLGFMSARRPVLRATLDHLRATWGDYDGYATEVLGVDNTLPQRLRTALLDPLPS